MKQYYFTTFDSKPFDLSHRKTKWRKEEAPKDELRSAGKERCIMFCDKPRVAIQSNLI
ncbi:hypothetical protein BgiBS90_028523, partial [Biomphalaria glabrata]